MIAALLAGNGGGGSSGADFFEVVRLLQAAHGSAASSADGTAGSARIGHQGPVAREIVRLRPALDFAFGTADVARCERAADCEGDGGRARFDVVCRFLGLYGTSSPLPACYTEQLLYDDPDGRLRAFLDVFNHRLLSFVYRAWEKYRHAVQFDARGEDPISRRLRFLCHVERAADPLALLGFAGLLHQQPLSEASLERILSASLEVPITVRSCVIRYVAIPAHRRSRLGDATCALGSSPIGDEMRAANTTFAVHIGPVPRATYLDFLPGGRRRAALCALLDRLNRDLLDCIVDVAIEPAHATPHHVGDGDGGLGWTTWLGADTAALRPLRVDTVSRTLHQPTHEPKVA